MQSKFVYTVLLWLLSQCVYSQGKWDQHLEIRYEMTDENEKMLNYIELTKDTLLYEWMDKGKLTKRKFVMDEQMQNKVLRAVSDNKVLKFKSRDLVKGQKNIVLTYMEKVKTKVVVFPSPIKPNSKEEKFIREFLEPILVKVFTHELKSKSN